MADEAMYANVTYEGDGVQTEYSFSFDYLRKAFVYVDLIEDGERTSLEQGTDYTIEDRTVLLTSPTTSKINIYRQTTTDPLVSWADASVLRASDMTLQETQLLHLIEETYDAVYQSGIRINDDGKLDATDHAIVNVADPEDDYDVTNKKYVDTQTEAVKDYVDEKVAGFQETVDEIYNNVNTVINNFDTSFDEKYEDAIQDLKDTAETAIQEITDMEESTIQKVEDTADVRIDQINDLVKDLMTAATNAVQRAQELLDEAQEAVIEADNAKDNAVVSASNANNSEMNAATSEANAATSETNAKQSADSAASSAEEAEAAADRAEAAALITDPDVYDSEATYNFPDLVVFTDGNIYRCVGTDVTGEDPDESSNWAQITYIYGDYFDEDSEGDLMPSLNPLSCDDFELDDDGDIMPQA